MIGNEDIKTEAKPPSPYQIRVAVNDMFNTHRNALSYIVDLCALTKAPITPEAGAKFLHMIVLMDSLHHDLSDLWDAEGWGTDDSPH